MTTSENSPEMVAFEALRPFCIPSTASHLSHVVITALRAAGLLKGCGGSCGPSDTEREFAETANRILDSDVGVDQLLQEIYEAGGETGA